MRSIFFILSMLIFSHLSFADEMTCDSIFKEIEELNEQQLKFKLSEQGATYENILKEYKVEMPILSILTNLKIKNINDISKLSQEETARNLVSYSKISTKCKKDATELTKECSEFLNSYLEGNLDGLIDAYKKTELNYKKALSKIQDSDEFKALAYVKKDLSLSFLNKKCQKEDGYVQENTTKLENYICHNSVHGDHTESMKDFAKDNLSILTALQVDLNKTSPDELKKQCDILAAKQIVVSSCLFKVKGDTPEPKNPKKGTKKGVKEDTKKGAQVVQKNKDEYEFQNSQENKDKGNKVEKSAAELRQIAAQQEQKKRKRQRFWKTTGIVAAAVGGTGLLTYGLYKLFEPQAQSNLTLPTASTTSTAKTYQTYQMNPYNQYMYNQYMYQMPYSNSNYGANWMGYQNFDSSPYTFEYGF